MGNLKIWVCTLITCFVIAAFFRSDFWEVCVKSSLLSLPKRIFNKLGTTFLNLGETLENAAKALDEEDNDNR